MRIFAGWDVPTLRAATAGDSADCICEYDTRCGGSGEVRCLGCGGDLCVCAACFTHGMTIGIGCAGCSDCEHRDDVDREED